jgi:tryptophan synthase alpha chain
MSRIQNVLATLAEGGRKALIPYICAGDPSPALTVPLMHALVKAGSDIVELGVPFSDPMADGPVIQRASERALKHGVSLADVLAMVVEFRKADTATPVVLMGYANPSTWAWKASSSAPGKRVSMASWWSTIRPKSARLLTRS